MFPQIIFRRERRAATWPSGCKFFSIFFLVLKSRKRVAEPYPCFQHIFKISTRWQVNRSDKDRLFAYSWFYVLVLRCVQRNPPESIYCHSLFSHSFVKKFSDNGMLCLALVVLFSSGQYHPEFNI